MAVQSKSSRLSRERSGRIPTIRGPLPVLDFGANKANKNPLALPLPLPEFQRGTQGNPPPDRGVSKEWPHGST